MRTDDARGGRKRLHSALALLVTLLCWQVLAMALAGGHVMASPVEIAVALVDGRNLWLDNIVATVVPAATGWLLGTAAGCLLAGFALLVPGAERPTVRIAAAVHSVPIIAIAPVLQVSLSTISPSTVLAGSIVVFTTTVAVVEGLRSAPPSVLAVSRGLGASPARILVLVRARAALPMLLSGLRVTWPLALIGALVGEYLGRSSGLGVYLVQQAGQLRTAQVWATAVVITAIALTVVVTAGAVARRLAAGASLDQSGAAEPPSRNLLTRVTLGLATNVLAAVVLCVLWLGYLWFFQVDPSVARTPADVAGYLFGETSHEVLVDALGVTLRDIGAGLVAGWLAGALLAVSFFAWPALRQALMPITTALAAAPIMAIIPLLTLAFGYSLAGIVAIVAIVVFFPTLVLVLDGLDSVPPDLLAVARSYGPGRATVLLRIRLPQVLPVLATGFRISCPRAVVGALLAQWMTSGRGLGHLMLTDSINYNYDRLWAATAITTVIAIIAYSLGEVLERAVNHRFGGTS